MLGITGILFSFLPQETANFLGWADTHTIALQMLGASYIGFARINWSAKAILMGGIYGKPIAIGNFTHFFIGALVLLKLATRNPSETSMVIATTTYAALALLFGYVLFNHPKSK